MKWSDLLMVKGQDSDCLQTLKYIVLLNMLHPSRQILMSHIRLFPKDDDRVLWEFKKDGYGDLHFIQLPVAWTIDIDDNVTDFTCQNKSLHTAVSFLYDIFCFTRDRKEWTKLHVMVFRLRNELPLVCDLCEQKMTIDPLYHPFLKNTLVSDGVAYIDRHCYYAQKILSQTRKQMDHDILGIVKNSFEEIKESEYDMKDKSLIFKRLILEDLRKLISFVQVREINFTEWLDCLLYLDKLQSPPSDTCFDLLMKKMWILLNLYFTEPRLQSYDNLFLYEDEVAIELDDLEDLEELVHTHPLKRSSILV